jgi:hypothetical protein
MNSSDQLVTDMRGRAVRLLVVASACTGLVAMLSGMAHQWDDTTPQSVTSPIFARMSPPQAVAKVKPFTDPAPVADAAAAKASEGAAPPAPPAAAAPVVKTAALAPVSPQPTPPPAATAQADPDETASITPDLPTPQPRPQAPPKVESLTLKVPRDVRIRSASAFSIGQESYRVDDVESLTSDPCKRGRRGCTRRPMRSLKQAVAGVTLRCSASESGDQTILSDCSVVKAAGRSRRASGGRRTKVARR